MNQRWGQGRAACHLGFALAVLLLVAAALPTAAFGAVTLSTLVSFNNANGSSPDAALVAGTNGLFYGTTSLGGSSGLGTVFQMTINGGITTLHSFSGTNDGATPEAPLLLAADGNFYGTTSAGGAGSFGTIFVMSASGQFTNLFSFNSTNGASPQGALIQGKDGNFYGTTSTGGSSNGVGSVFRLSTNGQFSTLMTFSGTNGSNPKGALVQGNNGNFYGVAAGGAGIAGTIFQIGASNSFTNIYTFTNGGGPSAGLALGTDGNFYGVTGSGGSNAFGSVFQLTTAGSFSTLFSFAGTNGAYPSAPLVQGADGKFYGTTSQGGTNGFGPGTVFSVTTTGAFTNLFFFPGNGSLGENPSAALLQGTNGNFFGTTHGGGQFANGTVFELSGLPPIITTQPSGETVVRGGTAVFTVSATGPPPLTFQWQFGSNNLADGGNISGAATATLTISNVSTANAGTNSVIVSDAGGSITSSPAILTIVNPPVVTITSPSPNARLPQSTITVTGKTSDNVTEQGVFCRLDNGGWVLATSANAWTNWSARFTVLPGTNTIQVYAVNNAGVASSTSSVSFFSTTLFAPVQGNYTGLFFDESNGVDEASSGFFTISATSRGTFTGSLLMGSGRHSFHGQFNPDGNAQVTVPRGAMGPVTMMLSLDLTGGSGQIIGMITNAARTAELLGNRAAFSTGTKPAPFKGRYTLAIPPLDDATNSPGGDGYGTLSIGASGDIIFNGSLADGTGFSQSTTVASTGLWPFYARLYGGQGLMLGWLSVSNGPSAGPGGMATWIKPAMAKARFYAGGFTNQVTVLVSPYAHTNGTAVLDLTNAMLVLSGGGLAEVSTNPVTLGAGSRATTSSHDVHLSFSLGTGAFSGQVGNAGTPKPLTFHGVALQNLGLGRGYFLNDAQSGEVLIEGQ